jgi:hypothetical protein
VFIGYGRQGYCWDEWEFVEAMHNWGGQPSFTTHGAI